jgi:alcohol dehydrogenase class IV
MAHSLGGYKDLPHGECNAMLLPHVIDFNFMAEPERFKVVAEAMGLDSRGMSTSEVRSWLLRSMIALRDALGIDEHLAAKGIRTDDIPVLSRKAVLDPCLVTNPKTATSRDIEVIYEEAT